MSLAAISDHGTGPFTEEIKVQTYEGGKQWSSNLLCSHRIIGSEISYNLYRVHDVISQSFV